MSVMLRTTNPAAAGDTGDHRQPYIGQMVVFHMRPGEGRGGKMSAPAMVTYIHDEDHVELLVIFAADDFITRIKIPRRSDQNNVNCWSFNDHDDINYGASPMRDEVGALATKLKALEERIEALEPGKKRK